MKKLLVVISLLNATFCYAICPDLSGTYSCKEEGASGELEISISQSTDENGTILHITNAESLLIDGKLEVQNSWGDIVFFQKLCEDERVVIRTGVEVYPRSERQISKNEDGALVLVTYSLEKSAENENLNALFDPITKAWWALGDAKLRGSKDEVQSIITKFASEKSIPTWKEAMKQGFIERTTEVCRRAER